jgi:hypothetical protein
MLMLHIFHVLQEQPLTGNMDLVSDAGICMGPSQNQIKVDNVASRSI